MLELYRRNSFDKDLRLMQKRSKKLKKLWDIVEKLLNEEVLPVKCRNHKLIGDMNGFWECHIEPDWLLIYEITEAEVILVRTGTHSDLFGK